MAAVPFTQVFEIGFDFNFGKLFIPKNYTLSLSGNATLVKALLQQRSVQRNCNGELVNIKDNRTPYSPEVLLSGTILFDTPFGLSLNLTGNYVGDQFTDELNTFEPSNNGRIGLLEAYYTLNGGIQYHLKKIETTLSFSVKNMTDNRYIATRRPQGIRVGLPTFVSFGIDKKF